jgi:hypothetical protein
VMARVTIGRPFNHVSEIEIQIRWKYVATT